MSSKSKGFKPLKIGLLMSDEKAQHLIDERAAEEFRRMNVLAESMGIPDSPTRWYQLALGLARIHVPELKTSRDEGAPAKWNPVSRILLANMVAREMARDGLTKAAACQRLATQDPWLSTMRGKPDGDALARQCTAKMLSAARNERIGAEQSGFNLDGWIDNGRKLMIEIEAERS
jgi:hypothetical protein